MFLEKCCFKGTFRKYQAEVLQEFDKHIKDKKINVVAAPGSGKTILGLQMICKLNQHVLILAPTITIRNQWKERFISSYVPEGMQIDFISDDVYNLNKFNIVTYQALHYALNKRKIKEESEREEEESNGRVKTEKIDYNLVQELKDKNIKTIVLDEAHHLRAEWWKSLCEVIKGLEDVKVISLTATPPYDVDENEWRKYEEICGTIDAEISVPELVATGDLCPHQDYVIFNMVTNQELSEIKKIRNDIDDFIKALKQNNEFIKMLKLNKILNNWQMNEEIILSDAQYYSSIIIFLNSIGVNIDKRIVKLISDAFIIPKFNKKWAEVLLKNIIYVHKEDYPESEQLIKDLKKQLEILGCVEKRNVYLEEVSAIKKLMASSIGKLESIEQIAEKEYGSLKENLSMVILADYVRYDYLDCNIKDINKIGVVPIFRRIHAKNISNNIAVLTGKLKIVSKSVVPYIKEQLKLININDDNIFSDLTIDNNYVVIEGSKKIENAIVKIVTECVNLKKINILIGTVALLGEGWDAPAVNSLILASYVGSFMLSNQMRGRAIRKSREQNKTANIWHLASLAKLGNNELDFSDLETLQRRFKGFVGIAYYDDLIQDGIDRLSIIDKEKLKQNYLKINEEMYKIALNRELMAERWKKILDLFGGTNIKIVDKLNGDFKISSKIFITMDFKRMLLSLLIVNIGIIIILGVIGTNFSNMIGRIIINIVVLIYYLVKIIRHLNPINYMKEIGKTILDSMRICNKLLTDKQLVSNKIEKFEIDGDKYYKVYLKGATVYENNLFIKSFEEVYNKVADTRYIICVKRKNKLAKDSYFNVPSILDNDKHDATIFLNEWNSNVCKGTLIYTRSKEGRKLLLKARKNSMSYNENFFVRKEVSRWE
ncbi:MAG: DEAD/DEAH box helicase family protein [Clostridia bacterium]